MQLQMNFISNIILDPMALMELVINLFQKQKKQLYSI